MKVFAGDYFYPAADASYKNLVWENLPAPDILFHMSMYTPAIVSLQGVPRKKVNQFNVIFLTLYVELG